MIEPWQVWSASVSDTDPEQPVVVISSEHHLELTGGRRVTVVPMTYVDHGLRHHVRVCDDQGQDVFVMTDQIRTMSSVRLSQQYVWTLGADERIGVRRALGHMAAF